jgi:hypothetical protein
VTDAERLHDIEQKLRCCGYLSHYPDAEHDVAWLLDKLADRDVRIAELEARLQRNEGMLSYRDDRPTLLFAEPPRLSDR